MSPRAARAASSDTPPSPTPTDVEEFLRHLAKERDVSPNTVVAYRRDLGARDVGGERAQVARAHDAEPDDADPQDLGGAHDVSTPSWVPR